VTIGVLGGGQLGRMLALAGVPLGQRFLFLDPSPESPAGHVGELRVAAYDDEGALDELARRCEVVTYEFESVPVKSARHLAEHVPVFPPPSALAVAQDRFEEKTFFERLAIPTAAFAAVDTKEQLAQAVARLGLPAILKTRRFGYDGKGQATLRTPADIDAAWEACGGAPSILERFVTFQRELSILTVRGRDGSAASYALVENQHQGGILRLSIAPAPGVSESLQAKASAHAERITRELDYVGVLAIEFFEVDGDLLANEMAPRVHNSGHWTIEGAETSQFENHLRAVLGLPLGLTSCIGVSAMINVIGQIPDPAPILAIEGAHLHMYGKEAAPGRKLGHVTVRASSRAELDVRVAKVRALT
jgi:5-(carboxyamino)imidazole ribonucleotide synthase